MVFGAAQLQPYPPTLKGVSGHLKELPGHPLSQLLQMQSVQVLSGCWPFYSQNSQNFRPIENFRNFPWKISTIFGKFPTLCNPSSDRREHSGTSECCSGKCCSDTRECSDTNDHSGRHRSNRCERLDPVWTLFRQTLFRGTWTSLNADCCRPEPYVPAELWKTIWSHHCDFVSTFKHKPSTFYI